MATRTRKARTEPAAFASAQEHVQAELGWLDLLLERQVQRLRAGRQLVESDFRGLFIPDEQVDTLLRPQPGRNGRAGAPAGDAIAASRAVIDRRERPDHPLPLLAGRFGLSATDRALLLIAAAPALDLRYETLFAYAQNDVTRRAATLGLALQMLDDAGQAWRAGRLALDPDHPLRRGALLQLVPDPQDPQPPLLAHYLKAEPRVVAYLRGRQEVDDRLQPHARCYRSAQRPADLPLEAALRERLGHTVAFLADRETEAGPYPRALLFLVGPDSVLQEAAAAATSAVAGQSLLAADLAALLASGQSLESLLPILLREAVLQGAALFLALPEPAELPPGQQEALLAGLAAPPCPVYLGCARPWYPDGAWPSLPFLTIELPLPDYPARRALWEHALGPYPRRPACDLDDLALKFSLSAGQIGDAARLAIAQAQARPAGEQALAQDDLRQAARRRSSQALTALAQKMQPRYRWEDIVLPAHVMRQLREVYNAVKFRHVVYSQWGFERKLALGKGLNALFSGPSGAGKTMAADILANELGLDLYRIDLSTVVSKYIGETEKNLSAIFAAAQASNAILFFDEADALFGKRSEVKDARDRYANIETAYLLQKMEEYDGVTLLATNLYGNMDDAFARRLHHLIDFPFPDARHRERIWRQVFPAETPIAADVDFAFLARQFELAGGAIRNVALSAAFMAAEARTPVTIEFLVLGVAREFQKLGRLPAKADFRDYYELVQGPE